MGTLSLVSGIAVAALLVLGWLGSLLYLRRMRRRMRAAAPPVAPDRFVRTAQEAHDIEPAADRDAAPRSIEDWIARAAELPDGKAPEDAGPLDLDRLERLAAKHFPHLTVPRHLHLFGLTGAEKRLLTWVCGHTGLPNPFDALERLTGDPDDLRRATDAWSDARADVQAVIDSLCTAGAALHERWKTPQAQRVYPLIADYLSELDALAATEEALRGLQAEAQLAEGTIVGLVNLLLGSLGGYLVEAVLTAGTMTPAVAAQAQLELTWVLKRVALALGRLQSVYANTKHILDGVSGLKGLQQMRARFQLQAAQRLESSIDAAG